MIFITGANGWLGLNLVSAIVSGSTQKWGLERDEIAAMILPGASKQKLLDISKEIKIFEGDITNKDDTDSFVSNSKDNVIKIWESETLDELI